MSEAPARQYQRTSDSDSALNRRIRYQSASKMSRLLILSAIMILNLVLGSGAEAEDVQPAILGVESGQLQPEATSAAISNGFLENVPNEDSDKGDNLADLAPAETVYVHLGRPHWNSYHSHHRRPYHHYYGHRYYYGHRG